MGAESTRRGEDGSAEASLSAARRKPIVSPRERVRSSRIAQGLPAQVGGPFGARQHRNDSALGLALRWGTRCSGVSCSHTCAP
jgi:hypothetical protein